MAKPFLKLIAEYVHENYKDNLEQLCIILPNKRGALFLKNYLAQTYGKTILKHIETVLKHQGNHIIFEKLIIKLMKAFVNFINMY